MGCSSSTQDVLQVEYLSRNASIKNPKQPQTESPVIHSKSTCAPSPLNTPIEQQQQKQNYIHISEDIDSPLNFSFTDSFHEQQQQYQQQSPSTPDFHLSPIKHESFKLAPKTNRTKDKIENIVQDPQLFQDLQEKIRENNQKLTQKTKKCLLQNRKLFQGFIVQMLQYINQNMDEYKVKEKYLKARQICKIKYQYKENPAPVISQHFSQSKIMKRRQIFTDTFQKQFDIQI